jgi:hypothetical protein
MTKVSWSLFEQGMFDIANATLQRRTPMPKTISLEDLITALEQGGKSDGQGIRLTSYDSRFTGKEARLEIIEHLARLRDLLD